MSRNPSKTRTWEVPRKPAPYTKEDLIATQQLFRDAARAREVSALTAVTPRHVIEMQPAPRPRKRALAPLKKSLGLAVLMLRSADWVVHFSLYHAVSLLVRAFRAPFAKPEPAAPVRYFPPLQPAFLPVAPWRPAEGYERVREPSAFGDSQYLSGSRLSDYEQLRQQARGYWDDIEAQDEEDFSDLFPGSDR